MYMLATNICIYVLAHRSERLRHKFRAIKGLSISSIGYGELCFGIENGGVAKKKARWEQLDLFTRGLIIEPWGEDAGRHYGSIRAFLKARGKLIGNNDLLIASHARSMGAVLVTNNTREFERVPDLSLENWLDD